MKQSLMPFVLVALLKPAQIGFYGGVTRFTGEA
jgi:hypothetical protein